MSKRPSASWQQAFRKRLGTARFLGTNWEDLYVALVEASPGSDKSAMPFWVGIELTHPSMSLGYTGVLCIDNRGKVLCTSEIQRHTDALEEMRSQWPREGQLRFMTDMDELRRATRRSIAFCAVVDSASPAALSLAESLSKATNLGNTQTALRVLTSITPPSSRRAESMLGSPSPTSSVFDVVLRSQTTKPWLQHRDLAVMCGAQRVGLIGVDFADVCSIFKTHRQSSNRWITRRPRPTGIKAGSVARGPGRAVIATKMVLGGIEALRPLPEISHAIVNVGSDSRLLRLKELKTVPELIREACPNLKELVLMDDYHDQGDNLTVDIIAVRT